jgi:hypothetical protein
MRLPFPLRLRNHRGLLVYQLVLILIAIIILILVLLYIARRNQIGVTHTAAERVPSQALMTKYSIDTSPLDWLQSAVQSGMS